MSFSEKIIAFNRDLNFPLEENLPGNVEVMNPFDFEYSRKLSEAFYRKYYSDPNPRRLILGINPGKSGAGITGIPFTSPQNLKKDCNIDCTENDFEVSGAFIYRMIEQYGGVDKFFSNYLMSNVCPLGFTLTTERGRKVNRNYYDFVDLMISSTPFIVNSLNAHIKFGIKTDKVFCLGTGDNFNYLYNLNKQEGLFDEVVPLEHPRYIAQFKKSMEPYYMEKFLKTIG